jgi:hypothetical protein|nr:MAG TPA: hypothetical protein [Caudoviricetes sp.]
MKYLLNTFRDESEATKYPNSVSVLYCVNGSLVFGYTYQNTIPLKLLKKHTETARALLGDNIEAIIKVNH